MFIITKNKELDYCAAKVEKCIRLVETATSEEQKKIYEGYLMFWRNKMSGEATEILAKKDAEEADAILKEVIERPIIIYDDNGEGDLEEQKDEPETEDTDNGQHIEG